MITRPEEHLSLLFTNNIIYFDQGVLYQGNWLNARTTIDYNCYWDVRTKNPKFHDDLLFTDWQKHGYDKHSIVADPLFVNPLQFDFRFKNNAIARKIKFKPFDYSKAGVYGSDEWIQKARMGTELEEKFDQKVSSCENQNHND